MSEPIKRIKAARRERRLQIWRVFKSNRAAYASLYVLASMAVMALVGALYTPYDPYRIDLSSALSYFSPAHPLGTDWLGRDMLSRVMEGARYTLGISLAAVLLGAALGSALGLISGYYGGVLDAIIQRATDVLLAFPTILLAIALTSVLGVGVLNVVLAAGVATVPIYIRLVRNLTLTLKNESYVEAARAMGLSGPYILFRHILPNLSYVIIVQSTYYMGITILIVSALGFLGLGVPKPIPEWGTMIGDARDYIFTYPHVVLVPGVFISVAALAFNLLGDGLRDALDPKMATLFRRA